MIKQRSSNDLQLADAQKKEEDAMKQWTLENRLNEIQSKLKTAKGICEVKCRIRVWLSGTG